MSTLALVLSDPAAGRVRTLWEEVEARFGLCPAPQVPFPHITLLGFSGLAHWQVKPVLEAASHQRGPLRLEAFGLGLFHRPSPVLHIPVLKGPDLTDLQRHLWEEVNLLGGTAPPIYGPTQWVPHITLAQGPGGRARYGEVVDFLLERDLTFTFDIRNITLFDWVSDQYEPCERFPLLGDAAHGAPQALPGL